MQRAAPQGAALSFGAPAEGIDAEVEVLSPASHSEGSEEPGVGSCGDPFIGRSRSGRRRVCDRSCRADCIDGHTQSTDESEKYLLHTLHSGRIHVGQSLF